MNRMHLCLLLVWVLGCSEQPHVSSTMAPRANAALQEIHDLCAERTRLRVHHDEDHPRFAEIERRIIAIHETELPGFETVAEQASLECAEEPRYGQPSYGIILYAVAIGDVAADELLLYHADRVYRTGGSFPELNTTGEGWYFRPKASIPQGERFVVACIQDAPEEIENVANGCMPNSDRARNPKRPYRTQIFSVNGQPLPHPE